MASITTVINQTSAFIPFGIVQNEAGTELGGDIILNPVGERVNSAMWASGDTTLTGSEFYTSSTQFASSVSDTGFVPPVSLEEGLARTLRYEFLEDNSQRPTFETE